MTEYTPSGMEVIEACLSLKIKAGQSIIKPHNVDNFAQNIFMYIHPVLHCFGLLVSISITPE
jgi:hypothetical protein